MANCECHNQLVDFFAQAEVNEVILHGATGWEVPFLSGGFFNQIWGLGQ
jgi:hypothetical protein